MVRQEKETQTVVIHGQKHDKITDRELQHIEQAPYHLLPYLEARLRIRYPSCMWTLVGSRWPILVGTVLLTMLMVVSAGVVILKYGACVLGMLRAAQIAIPFPLSPTQQLEADHKEDDTDTAAGKCATRPDVPC